MSAIGKARQHTEIDTSTHQGFAIRTFGQSVVDRLLPFIVEWEAGATVAVRFSEERVAVKRSFPPRSDVRSRQRDSLSAHRFGELPCRAVESVGINCKTEDPVGVAVARSNSLGRNLFNVGEPLNNLLGSTNLVRDVVIHLLELCEQHRRNQVIDFIVRCEEVVCIRQPFIRSVGARQRSVGKEHTASPESLIIG